MRSYDIGLNRALKTLFFVFLCLLYLRLIHLYLHLILWTLSCNTFKAIVVQPHQALLTQKSTVSHQISIESSALLKSTKILWILIFNYLYTESLQSPLKFPIICMIKLPNRHIPVNTPTSIPVFVNIADVPNRIQKLKRYFCQSRSTPSSRSISGFWTPITLFSHRSYSRSTVHTNQARPMTLESSNQRDNY